MYGHVSVHWRCALVGPVADQSFYPVYASCVALVMCVIILLTNGFTVFTKGNWDPSTFVAAYL